MPPLRYWNPGASPFLLLSEMLMARQSCYAPRAALRAARGLVFAAGGLAICAAALAEPGVNPRAGVLSLRSGDHRVADITNALAGNAFGPGRHVLTLDGP